MAWLDAIAGVPIAASRLRSPRKLMHLVDLRHRPALGWAPVGRVIAARRTVQVSPGSSLTTPGSRPGSDDFRTLCAARGVARILNFHFEALAEKERGLIETFEQLAEELERQVRQRD